MAIQRLAVVVEDSAKGTAKECALASAEVVRVSAETAEGYSVNKYERL